jgi:hypothetical protein
MLIRFTKGRWYTFFFTIMVAAVATCITCITATSALAQAEGTQDASKNIRAALDRVWQVLFLGQSGTGSGSIFQVVNTFMLFFAFAILAYRAILLYREATNEGSEEFIKALVVDKLIPVGVVLLLLGSNGLYGGYLVLSARNAIYNLDKQTGLKTELIAQTNQLASDYQGEAEALKRLQSKQADCAALDPEKDGVANPAVTQCVNELKAQANADVQSGAIKSGATVRKIEQAQKNDAFGDITGAIGDSLMKGLTELIKGWIFLCGVLYIIIVEGAMLIMGLIAPIAIATSLLNLKPIVEWVTKFIGLGIMKITYTLAVAAFQIINGIAGKELGESFFALALGFGAPFLSILAASQTGGIIGSAVEGAVLSAAAKGARFTGAKLGTGSGKAARLAGKGGAKIGGFAYNKLAPAPVKAAVSNLAARVRK